MQIPIFLQTFKESKNLKYCKLRLDKLNIKYKVFYSFNGKLKKNNSIVNKIYNSKKAKSRIGREMSNSEIACAYGHIKIYDYIVKRKIKNSLIIEDDAFISKNLINVIQKKINMIKKYDVIALSATSGFIYKKNNNFKDHEFCEFKTHCNGTGGYIINLKTCKKILYENKKKVCTVADWPLNFKKSKIKSAMLLPFNIVLINQNFSHLGNVQKISKNTTSTLLSIFYFILQFFYYFTFIPVLLGRYKNLNFYYEQFISKIMYKFISLFNYRIYDVKKILNEEKYYTSDLNLKFIKEKNKLIL